ncbi:MAG TPA: DUF6515 family protein [Mucilaginibacter sp.]|jgi:hypothetical protein|nr:DUF6515 family protein [Mucilaginibacter sp.]
MKRTFKYAFGLALAGLLTLALVPVANAQRGFHGGGGGIRIGGRSGAARIGGGFFRGGLNLGVRGGVYVGNTLFYGYPRIGFRFGLLPFGYYPFYWGADLYYYYGGAFYRPYDDGGYEVTTPPIGAAVPDLPKGAHSIVIDGQQYYEFNGVYFQPTVNDQGKTVYVVAGKDGVLNTNGDANNPPAPQVGDVINQLPDGCRKVKLNGKTYYVAPDGIYYEDFTGSGKQKAYRIVSIPSNDDGADEHQM